MAGFKDKVILITGEASSLSMGIIYSFLKEMAIVIFPAKSLHQVDMIKSYRDINEHDNFITLLIDVQEFEKLIETCETIADKFGKIDIAIEIPGFSNAQKDLTEVSIEEWNNMMETDMLPFFMGARVVLNLMKGSLSGMFVHISDSKLLTNLQSCALARVAFTTRMEMSKIFAEEAHRNGIRYYHLWAEDENSKETSDVSAEMISMEIMKLYEEETYNKETALRLFPKQLLHQVV